MNLKTKIELLKIECYVALLTKDKRILEIAIKDVIQFSNDYLNGRYSKRK